MSGFKRPGVQCKQCGVPFALAMFSVQKMESIEKLPDPFEAKCPACQFQTTYAKSEVAPLVREEYP